MKRARLLQWTASEMGMKPKWPMKFNVDNKACISFQRSTNPDSRLLGVFDLREGWVQELKDMKIVETQKIKTTDNISDLLTKCHAREPFVKLVALVKSKAMAF